MPILFLKASGAPRKYANMPGYIKVKGHWVRANKEAKTPAGAPKAAHPEAHAKGKPYAMPAEHAAKLLYPQEKAAKNHEMKNFNEKHVPNLLAHASEGDVTAILGSKYGTNTHAKKLVAIANHLLEQMGSTHKVSLGQQAGAHEGVLTHPKAQGEAKPAEGEKTPQNATEAAETPSKQEDKKALDAVADAMAEPMPEPEKPEQSSKGSLAMPAFMSGKQSKGVRTAYEQHGQKIIDAVDAGDLAGLQALVNPNAGAWKGKTANSKMLLGMYAQGLAKLQKKGNRITPVTDEPSAVAAVETIVQTPAQPKPSRKAKKGNVADIDWDSYIVPDNIKSAAGYNKQLAAVKAAAEAGDVYGILAAKYGTNTYAKKVAAAANMALTKLGHPDLKVVLGKTAVHPMLEQLPQPSDEAKETQQQIQEVQARQDEGPKEGDTRMGKSGMLVFHDGHWHKQETDEPVSDSEANPKFKAGSQVTPSQMLDLPAGTIVQCYTKSGDKFHQFLIGHSKAWFIPGNGKPHKTPLPAGKYAGLMGLSQDKYEGYTGGYHADNHPTTIVSVGAKGWMSEKMKAGLKVMYPGASSLTTPGIYPIFDGKMVLVTDLKNPTKGFAMDETGEWYIIQNVTNGYNDEVFTKVMNGEDPGNDLSVKLGLAPDLSAPLAPAPDHPEPGIASLLHSVTMSIEGEQYAMADHFVMLAAEALKEQPGSEASMNAMKWLIQAKGKAHEGASLAKPTIPDAPAPEVEPAKMKPLPEFKSAEEFHEWSKTKEADQWLDEGEVFYGSSDAWNNSPEAKAWDAWAEKHTKEQEAKWAAEAKAKEDEKKAKPATPSASTQEVWSSEIHEISNAMDTGNMAALQQIVSDFASFGSKAAKEVKAYAESAIAWLKANGEGFDPANFHAIIGKEKNLITQRDKAIELGKALGTEEGWQQSISYFKEWPTIAVKVAGEAIAQLGLPKGTPEMPQFNDPGGYEPEVNMMVAAAKYFDRDFTKTYLAGLKKFYADYTTPDGVKLNDYLNDFEAFATGKPKQQKEDDTAYDELVKELLNEDGTPKTPTAAEEGPHEGDMKMGKDGMLILKNGHWVKMGAEDIPQPTFSGAKAETLGKAVTKLMDALAEHGPGAIKNVAKITEHKTGKKAGGMTLTFSNGGKYFVFKHSETPDYANFANYLQSVKDWATKKVSKPKAKVQPAESAATAPATSSDSGNINYDALPSVESWKKVGGQKGSNEGESLEDENGQKWYVKYPKDEEHAQCEVLAASLYGALGLKAQDAQLVKKNGKLGIASRWIDGLKQGSPDQLAQANGALDGFLADVWMANRDVVGMSYDNLQIDADGDAVRVDAGASFFYRAQGEKKLFGADPVELTSMLDPSKNHQTHSVFKNMTKADYYAAAAKLADLPDAKIRIMVSQMGPGSKADRKRLADTLIARKNAILEKYPVDKHGKPIEALDPTKLNVDPDRLPKRHDFENWNGPGNGLSSKAHLNLANQAVEDQMLAVAKSGNLEKLKDFKFQPVNPSTGEPVGEKLPISQYPSKHVSAYHADLVNILEEIANPPVAMKIFHEIDVDSVEEIDAAFPPKPFGTTVHAVAAQEKMGQWVALGRVAKKDLAKITPKKFMSYSSEAIANAYDRYKKVAGKLAKAFINGIQASGAYNDLFREGKEFDHSGNKLSEVAQAALDFATEQPEGTTITRWQNMTPDMIKKILAAEDGTVITPIGSMCTSISPTGTSHFGPNRITIRYAKGAKAVESFGSGAFAGEKEVTTLPGARFVILSKKMGSLPGKSVEGLDLELLMLPPDIGL
ncbi:hypothetical protein D7B12_17980 [Salmonella enterica]|nr:hypothetical protein [Salmonella enterica]